MRRRSPSLLAFMTVAASSLAGAAFAADLPVPAPVAAPVYRPVIYDWTGIYFGGNLGGAWGNDTVTTTATTTLQTIGAATKVAPMGVIAGGQIGANYQFGWFVGG